MTTTSGVVGLADKPDENARKLWVEDIVTIMSPGREELLRLCLLYSSVSKGQTVESPSETTYGRGMTGEATNHVTGLNI